LSDLYDLDKEPKAENSDTDDAHANSRSETQ
jgi:hypothetical protein